MTRAERNAMCSRIMNIISVFVVATFVLWMLTWIVWGMEGDDHGNHGALKSWFDQLKSGKGLCCSFADGSVVEDVDWDTQDGHYRVRLDGKWIVVPDEAVIKEPNRFRRAVVWPTYYLHASDETKEVTGILCFMPGAGM